MIPFEKLPKTFQDTIILALGTDIEYVWIDSLCIIQGDQEDWKRETENMASVYKYAAFVVAASDAQDSSQGLFVSERETANVIAVPYFMNDTTQGTFNIAPMPNRFTMPGILESRAWALQERVLAERLVSFTKTGIQWRCETSQTLEGSAQSLVSKMYSSWLRLLSSYTYKGLTNATDRVYALRGIAEAFKKTRPDRYFDEYGVWNDDLASQIFWCHSDDLDEDRALDLPSWSWAARESSKKWLYEWYGKGSNLPDLTRVPVFLSINSQGGLASTGRLSTRALKTNNVRHDGSRAYLRSRLAWVSPEYQAVVNVQQAHKDLYVVIGGPNDESLGITAFDNEPSDQARCFLLFEQSRFAEPNVLNDGADILVDELDARDVALICCFSSLWRIADMAPPDIQDSSPDRDHG